VKQKEIKGIKREVINIRDYWTVLHGEPTNVIKTKEYKSLDELLSNIGKILNECINETPKPTPNEKKDKVVIKDVRPATAMKHRKKNPTDFKPLYIPELEDVWFCEPATIAWFVDGTKTVAIAGHGDKYDKETGLAICMLKRVLGNKEYRNIMDNWCYKKGSAN
jgi:hypothetical protein